MTSWVLNAETAHTAIGDLLALAAGSGVEIQDETGNVVAKIVVNPESHLPGNDRVEIAEADLQELRRRRSADRSQDVTTQQLLAKAASRERN